MDVHDRNIMTHQTNRTIRNCDSQRHQNCGNRLTNSPYVSRGQRAKESTDPSRTVSASAVWQKAKLSKSDFHIPSLRDIRLAMEGV